MTEPSNAPVTGIPFPVGDPSPGDAVRREGSALDAAIVAVTVFPDRARVTRRARVELPVGEHRVVFDDLPLVLDDRSLMQCRM